MITTLVMCMKFFNVYENSKNDLFRLTGLLADMNAVWPETKIAKIQFVRAVDLDNHIVYGFKKVNEEIIAYLLPAELYAGIIDINHLLHEKTFDQIKQKNIRKHFAY